MDLPPRVAVLVGLLAIVPVALYTLGRSDLAGVIAVINVGIIVGSLYLAFADDDSRVGRVLGFG